MDITLAYLAAILIVGGLAYVMLVAIRSYLRFYGTRLVICPETRKAAAVTLDATDAAKESFMGTSRFRLNSCSRWPERKGCGQECLGQIEAAPEDCLVKTIVGSWYSGKNCVFCGKPFDSADDIFHHRPALMGPDRKSIEWSDIRPENLPDVLHTALPVCWSCHIAEAFRREHPELVVDNPWQNRHGEWKHPEAGHQPESRKVA